MTALLAGFRLQTTVLRRSPGDLQILATVPLYTLIFLAMTDHSDRPGLAARAVLAPVLMALWSMALFTAGDIIDRDRQQGTLEATVAAPASLVLVLTGRIAAVTTISLAAFAEAWAVAYGWGVRISVHHPAVLAATVLATAFATAGSAALIAVLLVLSRGGRLYQNSLSYPFYLLSGILVPVSLLPDWVRPVSRLIFLSWSADLLRSALAAEPAGHVPQRLLALVALGLAGSAAATVLLRRVLNRVRVLGTLGHV